MIGRMQMQYASPIEQAWLGLWVSLFGRGSTLAKFIDQPTALPLGSTKPHPSQIRKSPESRHDAKIARAVAKEKTDLTRPEMADWAKKIIGDERISEITLDDIIDGIEDYFDVFDRLKKTDRDAYKYFSHVGPPLLLDSISAYKSDFERTRIPNPHLLPSYFGAFFPKTREHLKWEYDTSDFVLFQKPKKFINALAPAGTTIFVENNFNFKRNWLTREERKEHPHYTEDWSFGWVLGVDAYGEVKALPFRWQRQQELPGGGIIRHSEFNIPKGLRNLAKNSEYAKGDVHKLMQRLFIGTLVFTATAVSGVQVTIRKGKQSTRFGLPIKHLKTFFSDRIVEPGQRRKQIMHLVPAHYRNRDGKLIKVGDHLRGERIFDWRGYEVNVGVPGIHYPSPEGFNLPILSDEEIECSNSRDLISVPKLGKRVAEIVWRGDRPAIRRSVPTSSYAASTINVIEKS